MAMIHPSLREWREHVERKFDEEGYPEVKVACKKWVLERLASRQKHITNCLLRRERIRGCIIFKPHQVLLQILHRIPIYGRRYARCILYALYLYLYVHFLLGRDKTESNRAAPLVFTAYLLLILSGQYSVLVLEVPTKPYHCASLFRMVCGAVL